MITIVSSTHRHNSLTRKVVSSYEQLLISQKIAHRVLSLEELPHDFIFTCFDGQSVPAFDQIVQDKIVSADRFIVIVPEYNGGYPGILKAFLDCLKPALLHGKKVALVGLADGHAGALRPLDELTLILHHLKMHVYFDKPKLSAITQHMHDDGKLDEAYMDRLQRQLSGFLSF